MKRAILSLLLLLLLCGCVSAPGEQPSPTPEPSLPILPGEDLSLPMQSTPDLVPPLTLEEYEAAWVLDYDGQQLLLAQGPATGYQDAAAYRTDYLLRWDLADGLERHEIGSDAYVTSGLCCGEDLFYMDYYWRGNDKFWTLVRIRNGVETELTEEAMEWSDALPRLFRLNGQAMYLCRGENGPQVYRVEEDGVSLVLEVPGYADFGMDVCSNGSCYAFTVRDEAAEATRLLVCDQTGLRYQVSLPMECMAVAINAEYAAAAMTDRQSGLYACQTLRLSDGASGIFDSSVPMSGLTGSGSSCLFGDDSTGCYVLYPAMGDLQELRLELGAGHRLTSCYSDGRGGYLLRMEGQDGCLFRQITP